MSKPTTILDLVKIITVIGGAIAMLVGGGRWVYSMTELIATKAYVIEYGEQQMGPVRTVLVNVETSAVVQRIRGLLDLRCAALQDGTWTNELQSTLDEQVNRYFELTGRHFNIGRCENGVRVR